MSFSETPIYRWDMNVLSLSFRSLKAQSWYYVNPVARRMNKKKVVKKAKGSKDDEGKKPAAEVEKKKKKGSKDDEGKKPAAEGSRDDEGKKGSKEDEGKKGTEAEGGACITFQPVSCYFFFIIHISKSKGR